MKYILKVFYNNRDWYCDKLAHNEGILIPYFHANEIEYAKHFSLIEALYELSIIYNNKNMYSSKKHEFSIGIVE